MKRLLIIIILTFSFESWTKADDIRDFEIEGMSIGDSLLKKFSRDEIESFYKAPYYKDDLYTTIDSLEISSNNKYDYISYSYKTNDKDYILVGLVADVDSIKSFNNNIENCYPLMVEIVNELKTIFINSKQKDNGVFSHPIDKSGKSIITNYSFYPNNGGNISVSCYDYSEETSYADSLRVGLITSNFDTWLSTIAYK